MNISEAVSQNIPVLYGIRDGNQTRVWCDSCFEWHWHGDDGLKVPHCPWAAGYYLIINDPFPIEEDQFGYRRGTRWRIRCSVCMKHHLSVSLGEQTRPHHLNVIARPGPGSPVFCQASGRFFDMGTAEVVEPNYSESDMARFQYHVKRSLSSTA